MKKLICLLVLVCVPLTSCGTSKEIVSRDLNTYVSDCEFVENASVLMPSIADLGAYSQINYTYQVTCYSKIMGFYSGGLALFIKYDQTTYVTQKEKTLQSYTFLDEPVKRYEEYELPLTEFEYNDYNMKVVPDQEYIDFCACKSFMMIGFNDDNNAMAFLYYYDFDIDYIAEENEDLYSEMCRLVDNAFAWEAF